MTVLWSVSNSIGPWALHNGQQLSFRTSRKTTQEQLRKTKQETVSTVSYVFHKIILYKPIYSLTLYTNNHNHIHHSSLTLAFWILFCCNILVCLLLTVLLKAQDTAWWHCRLDQITHLNHHHLCFNSFFSNESGLSGDLLVCLFHLFWKRTFGDKCHGFLLSTQQQNKLWTGCHGTFYSHCHQSLQYTSTGKQLT